MGFKLKPKAAPVTETKAKKVGGKVTKKEESSGPKKKVAGKVKSNVIPISEGKKKKVAGKTKAKKRHVARPMLESLTKTQASLLNLADKAERGVKEAESAFQKRLKDLANALDGHKSFEHPEHGPYSLMERDGLYFWRPKPTGYTGGAKKKSA